MKKKTRELTGPLLLAIESATMCGSVAILSGDRCLVENSVATANTHSRRLIQQVDQVMRETELDWHQIDGIAVSLGPGSFTGLRIGLSIAKGLAMASGRPLLGVSTLDGLAKQIVAMPGCPVCALLDARKKEVYAAFYVGDADGIPTRTGPDMVITPSELAALIKTRTILVGDGASAYRNLLAETLGEKAIFTPVSSFFPRAATIGRLAAPMFADHDFIDPGDAVPIYVRPSDAELTIKQPG